MRPASLSHAYCIVCADVDPSSLLEEVEGDCQHCAISEALVVGREAVGPAFDSDTLLEINSGNNLSGRLFRIFSSIETFKNGFALLDVAFFDEISRTFGREAQADQADQNQGALYPNRLGRDKISEGGNRAKK